MRYLIPTFLMLAACDVATQDRLAEEQANNNYVCVDGVQYIRFDRSMTAHLKPDGKPFTCRSGQPRGPRD